MHFSMTTTATKRDNTEINKTFDLLKQTLVYINVFVAIREGIYATLIGSNITTLTHSATSSSHQSRSCGSSPKDAQLSTLSRMVSM